MLPVLPTAQRAPAARLPHTPAARATAHCCARRTPRQCSRLPSPHAHAHRSQACRASPCSDACSDVRRQRAREGAPCHRSRLPLPPTAWPPHISSVRCRPATRWPAQPLVTHALFAPATPCTHRANCGLTVPAHALPARAMPIVFIVCSVSSGAYDRQSVALYDPPALVRVPSNPHTFSPPHLLPVTASTAYGYSLHRLRLQPPPPADTNSTLYGYSLHRLRL